MKVSFTLLFSMTIGWAGAQDATIYNQYPKKFSLMFGLTQPVFLKGFNVAGTYFTNRVTFEYSHGVSLDFQNYGRTRDEKDQNLSIHQPWTTGFGVGYSWFKNFDTRLEFKANRYEVTHPYLNQQISYNTYVIGVAVYYRVYFGKAGLFIDPSVRYWPNMATTLSGNEYAFQNAQGGTDIHKAHSYGLFANMSFGYTFK